MENKLGFGCLRLPIKNGKVDYGELCNMIDYFIGNSFNYFDTAHGYMNGTSEMAIKECLVKRYPREKFILANKLTAAFFDKKEDIMPFFEMQLRNCGVEYFDYYLMHAQNTEFFKKYKECGAYEIALHLRDIGKIKHFGISFHDKADVLEQILIEYPQIEVVQIQLNYLDFENPVIQSRLCYEVCRKYKKDIIVMEPVKGGSLVRLPLEAEKLFKQLNNGSNASYAIRYAASFDGVKIVLSGMSNIEQVKDNVAFMKELKKITSKEMETIKNVVKIINNQNIIPCTSCRYCVEGCPKRIPIPDLFADINAKKLFKDWNSDIYYKSHVQNKSKAGDCIKCGKCEKICPQHLEIRKYLEEVSKIFEGKGYSDEQNVQVLIALLKEHGIRRIIVSPGSTNLSLVGSIQYDPDFEIYSCVDERSAAYMACGMAEESGEPVCLSCTGATASRNYLPGLTEAFYKKLPVLAITSTQFISKVGHNVAQVIDRTNPPKDTVKHSVTLPVVKDRTDFWDCVDKVNIALLELKRNGGGPVHINLQTGYSKNFNVSELPYVRVIRRVTYLDKFPIIPANSKVAIFVGSHRKMDKELTDVIDRFCISNNAVVFCDHTSGYSGKYKVRYSLVACQKKCIIEKPDLLIYIGDISGDYYSLGIGANDQVWRVSEDGEVRDPIGRLTYVFDMKEQEFFNHYSNSNEKTEQNCSYLECCKKQLNSLRCKLPEFPFSNIWIASKMAKDIPSGSVVHFGILNSLRAWNFFELPLDVDSTSNVGGFGIDGCISSLVGASLVNPNKLHFIVVGDLAFFYDMNVLGNRHIKSNIRILLINNGKGTEFRNYGHYAQRFGKDVDKYIAAAGHFGNKSNSLIRHYAEDLGFLYLSAVNKEEFIDNSKKFTDSTIGDKPILLEVFTDSQDESKALEEIVNLEG